MAQTAMIFQDGEFSGVATMSDKEVEETVKEMLKQLPLFPGRIRAAERAAEGKGLSRTIARGKRLSAHEERLATVGRVYTASSHRENMHMEKAERLFAGLRGDVAEDQAALEELAGIMVGSRPKDYGEVEQYGLLWNGLVVPYERAIELAGREAEDLRGELAYLEGALADLEAFDRYGATILRMQYAQGKKVVKVMEQVQKLMREEEGDENITLAESTYHLWRKAAVKSFGTLVGLC